MIACTGHTWQQVRDDWDLPRLTAWTKYTGDHPPLHTMVAAYLGIKPKSQPINNDDVLAQLLSVPGLSSI